jgi:hypothetical protein
VDVLGRSESVEKRLADRAAETPIVAEATINAKASVALWQLSGSGVGGGIRYFSDLGVTAAEYRLCAGHGDTSDPVVPITRFTAS